MEIKNIIPAEKGWKAEFDNNAEFTIGVALICWALVEVVSETQDKATATRVPVRFSYTEVHGLIVGESGVVEDAETLKHFKRYVYS